MITRAALPALHHQQRVTAPTRRSARPCRAPAPEGLHGLSSGWWAPGRAFYTGSMVRRRGRPRHLVVDRETFLWSLGNVLERNDEDGASRYMSCTETVTVRRNGSRGRLDIVFRAGAGQLVSDGLLHAGAVLRVDVGVLNLNEPGVVRALLDEALARGWQPDAPDRSEIDGWTLFDAVLACRAERLTAERVERRSRAPAARVAVVRPGSRTTSGRA